MRNFYCCKWIACGKKIKRNERRPSFLKSKVAFIEMPGHDFSNRYDICKVEQSNDRTSAES